MMKAGEYSQTHIRVKLNCNAYININTAWGWRAHVESMRNTVKKSKVSGDECMDAVLLIVDDMLE